MNGGDPLTTAMDQSPEGGWGGGVCLSPEAIAPPVFRGCAFLSTLIRSTQGGTSHHSGGRAHDCTLPTPETSGTVHTFKIV